MNLKSTLVPELLAAYRETEYRVHAHPELSLRIDQHNPALARAHQAHGVTCSAYITACNPHSQRLDAATNAKRQTRLEQDLIRRGLSFLPGIGQHPGNDWPGEESFLIFGLNLDAAKALAGTLEQNALLWAAGDAIPRLICLPYP